MTQESGDFSRLVGTVLSERYQIKALLGQGGMGAVFEGEHLLMHKRVAIKLLHPEMSQAGEVVARFEREAMAAAHIDHPNVVTATDFGKTPDGGFFLVLEYVEGCNLRQLMLRERLSVPRALRIAEQVSSALIKAHGLGIVHRDLKPENVMLVSREGDPDFVKVLDFGIAKVPVESLSGQQVQTGQGLTRMGVMYGTPEYMAPEQAMGTGVDHRADMYALGVMLFEMVTGARPFDADSAISLITMHITEPAPPLSSRVKPGVELPPGLEALVAKLLEKDRENRVQSARELVEQLRAMQGAAQSTAHSPAPPSIQLSPPASREASEIAQANTAQARTAIQYTPTAALPQAEAPWRRDLRQAVAQLEEAKSKLPPPLAALPLAVFPLAASALVLLLGVVALWPRAQATTPGATPSASAPALPTELTDEQLDEARRAGASSLEALAERYPDDPRMLRAMMRFYHENKRPADAVKALTRLAKREQSLISDDLVLAVLKAGVDGPPEASDATFALLESGMGEAGIEVLYALWTSKKKDVSARAQERAGKSLAKAEVKERAGKPLLALLNLRLTPASCETRRQGAELAREAGDARAVPYLQQLTSKRGCGFAGLQDCWGCLRKDNLVQEAIKAAEKRPEP